MHTICCDMVVKHGVVTIKRDVWEVETDTVIPSEPGLHLPPVIQFK